MKRGIDLAKELGLTYRQVHHWASRGYVNAPVSADGDITTLAFDAREERILRIMAGLVAFGMRPEPAAAVARMHVRSGKRNSMIDIKSVGSITIGG